MRDTPEVAAATSPASGAAPLAGRRGGPLRHWRHRIGLALGVAAAAAVGLLVAWQLLLRPLEVTLAAAGSDAPIEVYGLGSVEARVLSAVGFEVAGTLRALHADEGDHVAAGAVLAELDRRQQAARVAQAEAGLAQARAALEEAEAGLNRAEVQLGQARRSAARRQELARRQAASEQSAEEALTAVETAAAERVQAAARIRLATANLQQAEATLAGERTLLAQHTLLAPFDAIVVTRRRELGAPARAADAVFDLVDPASVWIRAYVDEARAGGLAVGQPVTIRLRSLPGAVFQGRLARIGIENDRIGEERRIELTCHDCPAGFHLGEQAEAIVTTGHLAGALLVPLAAFEEADARGGVLWTVEDGRLGRRRIEFGQRTLDGRVAVAPDALPAGAAAVALRRPGLRVGRAAVGRPGGGAS